MGKEGLCRAFRDQLSKVQELSRKAESQSRSDGNNQGEQRHAQGLGDSESVVALGFR